MHHRRTYHTNNYADLPLFGIRTMDEQLAQARWPFRVFGTMFAIFALIALTLSAVMPLPESLPELAFAGALGGRRVRLTTVKSGLPIAVDADFDGCFRNR